MLKIAILKMESLVSGVEKNCLSQYRIDEVVQYIVSDSGIFCFYLFGTIVVTDAIVVRYGIDRI